MKAVPKKLSRERFKKKKKSIKKWNGLGIEKSNQGVVAFVFGEMVKMGMMLSFKHVSKCVCVCVCVRERDSMGMC